MKLYVLILSLSLAGSAVSLAATSTVPRLLPLRFTIGDKHARFLLNLKPLHNLAARGGEYEQQAQLALENIKLLPSVDSPILMIQILWRISNSKAEHFRNHKELHGDQRSLSYREQKEFWEAIHESSYIQDKINEVYHKVGVSLKINLYGSKKLFKLLSPLEKDDYLKQVRERVRGMRSIWIKRNRLDNLFDRYAVESKKLNDAGSYPSKEEVKKLVDKIMAEMTEHDAVRAEKIQQQAATVASQFTHKASEDLSEASYFQAMLAEMLYDNGVKEQEQEAQFQLLVSDYWAAHAALK